MKQKNACAGWISIRRYFLMKLDWQSTGDGVFPLFSALPEEFRGVLGTNFDRPPGVVRNAPASRIGTRRNACRVQQPRRSAGALQQLPEIGLTRLGRGKTSADRGDDSPDPDEDSGC